MNQLKIIGTFLFLFGLHSCEPPVTFTEPQPVGVKNLAKIPSRLQGEYVSLNDSSTLVITEKIIQRIYDVEETIHPSELDSNCIINGDTILNVATKEKNLFTRVGDSLKTRIHWVDTLFVLNYDNVLRKFKGYYFANIRFDEAKWEVKKLHMAKGELIFSSITSEADIKNLQEITESVQDTVPPYTFTTSKKQFKKFVKSDGFGDQERFIKIKN